MDAQLANAARALSAGHALIALKHVGLRKDAAGVALRGIALAQLGELRRAGELLGKAARAFGSSERKARARCLVAAAEVAIAARELGGSDGPLMLATRMLDATGDRHNATHARLVLVRKLLLLGRLADAERQLGNIEPKTPPLAAIFHLVSAECAARAGRARLARAELGVARKAAEHARIPALIGEVESAQRSLDTPVARLLGGATERPLLLDEVETLRASSSLLVDGCRFAVGDRQMRVLLARRPVLFALARGLAEAWPGTASRETLLAQAFAVKRHNDSHRARLRVEIGRLRKALRGLAAIEATADGFLLKPDRATKVAVLAPPVDDEHGSVLALVSDGRPWSSSAIAIALGASQRTVQRALSALEASDRVRAFGLARAKRWSARPPTGFTTLLLLPTAFARD